MNLVNMYEYVINMYKYVCQFERYQERSMLTCLNANNLFNRIPIATADSTKNL